MLLQRVADAQVRFLSSPLFQVANRLEQEVLVSSIYLQHQHHAISHCEKQ